MILIIRTYFIIAMLLFALPVCSQSWGDEALKKTENDIEHKISDVLSAKKSQTTVTLKFIPVEKNKVEKNNIKKTTQSSVNTQELVSALKEGCTIEIGVSQPPTEEEIQERNDAEEAQSKLLSFDKLFITMTPESLNWMVESRVLGVRAIRLLFALTIFIAFLLLYVFLRRYINLIIKREQEEQGNKRSIYRMLVSSIRRALPVFFLGAVVSILSPVLIHDALYLDAFMRFASVLMGLAVAIALYDEVRIVDRFANDYIKKKEMHISKGVVSVGCKWLRVFIIFIALLHFYQTISGNSITTLIAGLSIGAGAIALASTDALKNLFGFVVVHIDKPFKKGDRIVFGEHDGFVQNIGIRSTRVRRLDSHIVYIPNSKITDNVLRNVSLRECIKFFLYFRISHEASAAEVSRGLDIIKEISVKHKENIDPDNPPRVYLTQIEDNARVIEVTYWYTPTDWWECMEFQSQFNTEVLFLFEKEGIAMATTRSTITIKK